MEMFNKPYSYLLQRDFIDTERFSDIINNYPVKQIKSYCSNPEVNEYESALEGNYSSPVCDTSFTGWVEDLLPELKTQFLGDDLEHDHHYCNYHYDLAGTSLGIHNDLKGFRWLITTQIYLDDGDDGVRILDKQANPVLNIPQEFNLGYSIFTTPYSWHDVPQIQNDKHSILFRVGKKRSRSVVHSDPWEQNSCYIIVNDHHCDTHYAKLGPRMGNLTEAWLWSLDVKNIYHSEWRDHVSLRRVIKHCLQRHKTVRLIHSGYFPKQHPDIIDDNCALKTVTDHNSGYHMNNCTKEPDLFLVTDNNYKEVADVVFRQNRNIDMIAEAEDILEEYTDSLEFLNYRDINLPKV